MSSPSLAESRNQHQEQAIDDKIYAFIENNKEQMETLDQMLLAEYEAFTSGASEAVSLVTDAQEEAPPITITDPARLAIVREAEEKAHYAPFRENLSWYHIEGHTASEEEKSIPLANDARPSTIGTLSPVRLLLK